MFQGHRIEDNRHEVRTVNRGGVQDVAAPLHKPGEQNTEAHAQEVVELQESVDHDDGQKDAQRQVAQLLHSAGRSADWQIGRLTVWWADWLGAWSVGLGALQVVSGMWGVHQGGWQSNCEMIAI